MASVITQPGPGSAVMTIDRPPANAMDLGLLEELAAALEAVSDAPPPALVIAGREGCFSAGLDLKAAPSYGPEQRRAMVAGINRMALAAYGLPCPLVAAVTGHAIAGGMVLALCADYRIASAVGRYGLTEVQVGVPYPQAAIGVVRAELAPAVARSMVLTGRLTGAEKCARLGLFDEVLAPERVLERALEVAAELAALPPDTFRRTKADLRSTTLAALREAAAADPLLSL